MPTGSDLIEHEPGDLTCVVEAGMKLSALQDRLGGHGQMLALDPPGDPTVGELVDGNLSGPRRHRYGAPRDLVIGMTVRLADGTVASSGGKVVKNVAGYDLGKLFCGARGRFGEVLRVAFRLHPQPAATASLAIAFATPSAGSRVAQTVLRSQLVPSAVDMLVAPASGSLVAVLFEGSERAVRAQVEAARKLVGGDENPSVWRAIAEQQRAARGCLAFEQLEALLATVDEAVVRVAALTAYVPDELAYEPPPLVDRIVERLAG